MRDNTGRTIDYIRISLTDLCNLRCGYCMPSQGVVHLRHEDILTLEEILRLCRLFARLGVSKFKVTGGEPLVRRGIDDFLPALKQTPGVEQVTLTTNGLLLAEHLDSLVSLGLDGINISLDTLDRERYRMLTGADGLPEVLSALTAAIQSGIPVKINCVPLAGINESELADIAALARDRVRAVRFIELMPLGPATRYSGLPAADVHSLLEQAYGPLRLEGSRLGNGPAQYFSLPGFEGRIGFIDALSHAFCASCNRVRLTAEGMLKLCLAHDIGVDLRQPLRAGADDASILRLIQEAVMQKPTQHNFAGERPEDEDAGMYRTGG